MLIEKAIAFLDNLSGEELDKLPPARREKFAALCHHWAQLPERPPKPKEPKAGVLSRHRDGERPE
jgi:hypothetical protein